MFTIFSTAFAMLPFGAWAAFSAAALTLISSGNEAAAAGVFCWGAVIMLAGDHFVWPVLVGGSARLRQLVVSTARPEWTLLIISELVSAAIMLILRSMFPV
jgi:predicted PurR-regulated permease PerM